MNKSIVRICILMFAIVLAVPMFGNGQQESVVENGTQVKLIAAHVNSDDSSYQAGMVAFKNELEKISNGQMTVEIHSNGSLGGAEEELVQKMATGTVDVIVASPNFLAQIAPKIDIFSMPYLFSNYDHWSKVINGQPGQTISAIIDKETEFKMLGYWTCGVRSYFGTKPVKTLADMKGVKIRVLNSPLVQKSWQALGAQPANVAYNELYQALQNKVIDAAEQDLGNIYLQKFYEAGKYISLTEHDIATRFFLMGGKKFKGLSQQQQDWVIKAAGVANTTEMLADRKLCDEAKEKLIVAGAIFNDVDKDSFIKATEQVRNEAAKSMKVEDILQEINSLR